MSRKSLGISLMMGCCLLAALTGCSKQALAPEVAVQGGVGTLPPFEQAKAAVVGGDLAFVKSCVEADARYVEAYDDKERTLLHYAAAADQLAIAEYLIEKGAYVNIDDDEGMLPFDAALQGDASESMKDLLKNAGMKEAGIQ